MFSFSLKSLLTQFLSVSQLLCSVEECSHYLTSSVKAIITDKPQLLSSAITTLVLTLLRNVHDP